MKYICLGYIEPGKFENMSESERNTVLDECFSYNDELRKNGHLVAGPPLRFWQRWGLTPPASGSFGFSAY